MDKPVKTRNAIRCANYTDFPSLYERLGDKACDMEFHVSCYGNGYVLLAIIADNSRRFSKPIRVSMEFYNAVTNGKRRNFISGRELLPLVRSREVVGGGSSFITISEAYPIYMKKRAFTLNLVEKSSDYYKFHIYRQFARKVDDSRNDYIITSRNFIDIYFGDMDIGTGTEMSYLLSQYEKHSDDEDMRLKKIMDKIPGSKK